MFSMFFLTCLCSSVCAQSANVKDMLTRTWFEELRKIAVLKFSVVRLVFFIPTLMSGPRVSKKMSRNKRERRVLSSRACRRYPTRRIRMLADQDGPLALTSRNAGGGRCRSGNGKIVRTCRPSVLDPEYFCPPRVHRSYLRVLQLICEISSRIQTLLSSSKYGTSCHRLSTSTIRPIPIPKRRFIRLVYPRFNLRSPRSEPVNPWTRQTSHGISGDLSAGPV